VERSKSIKATLEMAPFLPRVFVLRAAGSSAEIELNPIDQTVAQAFGTALRRTLLSSVPGAAITRVRFDDALHEFTTIPGVAEDVTDIILNLKDVVLRSSSEEPVVLRLDKRGPGVVRAGDIQTTSDVEIVSPEAVIATLNTKGRLSADIWVEQGYGYKTPDGSRATTAIGEIPVDATFSPVRRVAVKVAQMPKNGIAAHETLHLDVDTDSSTSAVNAVASAAKTLGELYGLIANIGEPTETPTPVGFEWPSDEGVLLESIESLELSQRPRNALRRSRIETIGELVARTPDELLALPSLGDRSLDEILDRLEERDLQLRGGPYMRRPSAETGDSLTLERSHPTVSMPREEVLQVSEGRSDPEGVTTDLYEVRGGIGVRALVGGQPVLSGERSKNLVSIGWESTLPFADTVDGLDPWVAQTETAVLFVADEPQPIRGIDARTGSAKARKDDAVQFLRVDGPQFSLVIRRAGGICRVGAMSREVDSPLVAALMERTASASQLQALPELINRLTN
jgi:DNA-directed RNA polymerase subunit alpha